MINKKKLIKSYEKQYPNINVVGADKGNDDIHFGYAEIFKDGEVIELSFNQLILPMRIDYLEHMFGLTPNENYHYTMNKHLHILEETNDLTDVFSGRKLQYVMFGNGGVSDTNMDKPYSVKPFEVIPYNIIPIRTVLATNDVEPIVREKLRLRKIDTINGKECILYYAKKLDIDPNDYNLVEFDSTSTKATITTNSKEYSIDIKHSKANNTDLDNKSIIAYKAIDIKTDVEELKEYFRIMNNDDISSAKVSEIIIGFGKDKENVKLTNSDGTVSSETYTEVIGLECGIKYTTSPYFLNSIESKFATKYLITSFGTSK